MRVMIKIELEWSISGVDVSGQVDPQPVPARCRVTLGFTLGNLYDVSYDYRRC